MNAATRFRTAAEQKDIAAAEELFAPGIVFHSPVTFHPFVGRETVTQLLSIVADTFEDFRYTDQVEAGSRPRPDLPRLHQRPRARGHRPAARRRGRSDR